MNYLFKYKKFGFLASFLCTAVLSCTQFPGETFKKLSPFRTGIDFINTLIENDTLNYIKFPYMYMGGGISTGDINNDGLDDIFFTGNLVPNTLYLNKGNMHFEDISEIAGITGNGQWFTGTTMADVNNDGWLDIYVCVSAKYKPSDNLLFINNKDNTFTETAKSYGINDQSSSVQATFFDYNNDGLLDLYVANYPIVLVSMGADFYRDKMNKNLPEESGHLYKNNGNGTFTNVTDEAGVRNFGMSIGVVAMDFNNDGWKDLYISNDFNPPDYFYLNKGDGTFREVVKEATSQTSIFGMGFDAADINNDGLLDMYQIDMTPPDHYRRMVNVIPMRQETFDRSLDFGFHYQYMQNSLQLNNGVFDSIPVFSNIALFANVAYTDWSWGGLFMDMDNDGNKDLFVTNGVLKDINNQDIMSTPRSSMYFETAQKKEYRPELFPSTPVKNFVFRNNGNFSFSNEADKWGFSDLTLTNGVSYGDFDNDGDLDIVIHNVNAVSPVYENKVVKKDHHFLKVKLNGPKTNLFGLGSIVFVKTAGITQKQELTLTRGYQSSVPPIIHFGLGKNTTIDELVIIWPDGKKQVLRDIKADQILTLYYHDAADIQPEDRPVSVFSDITTKAGISFRHKENTYHDYIFESLLPYQYSRIGPGLTVGDINNDGLDDFFIGNSEGFPGAMYVQDPTGNFKEVSGPWIADSLYEDTGALLFDANGDGLKDLYVVSGGNSIQKKNEMFTDRLYMNTGKGFIKNTIAIPHDIHHSGKCIKAADYDGDGDLDLFIGGRIVPGRYPYPASSLLLENNGLHGDQLKFEDVTQKKAPALIDAGLVTDATWDDFDDDGDPDLIIAGEWMNIRLLQNSKTAFNEITEQVGLENTSGWWYAIKAADVDNDGDRDFIAGNLGLNYRYKANENSIFEIYYNDFDVDGKSDIVLGYSENGINYPVNSFFATSNQIPVIQHRYKTFDEFGKATLQDIYGAKILETSLHYSVNTFASMWIENKGNNTFITHTLPCMAQFSSINDMAEIRYKNSTCFIVAGNLYSSEVETPRNDAGIGLVLQFLSGELRAIPPAESGLFIKGEVKAIQKIKLATGKEGLLFATNNDLLKLIEINNDH